MIFLCGSFLLVPGCIAGALVAEITCWSWLAGLLYLLSSERLPEYDENSLQFYFSVLKWINSAEKHQIGSRYKGCTSYTKQQDKMMRLASANWIIFQVHEDKMNQLRGGYRQSRIQPYIADPIFKGYLQNHRASDQYMKVTYRGLRNNVENKSLKQSQFMLKFWDLYGVLMCFHHCFCCLH